MNETKTMREESINFEVIGQFLPDIYVDAVVSELVRVHGNCPYSKSTIVAVRTGRRKNIDILNALITVAEREKTKQSRLQKRISKLR